MVTTAPAPITAPMPIRVHPGRMKARSPTQASCSIVRSAIGRLSRGIHLSLLLKKNGCVEIPLTG
ncbi:MAG TPA: hypothetical protein DIC50_02760 [Verrucomicrobia subdivision 3 bacterium]|nr:hypothetical protein [Limisphaerales bacterium]